MNNLKLGKIILFLVLPYLLYSSAVLKVGNEFYKGDVVQFSITASGKDIKIPNIDTIENYSVQTLGTSSQTRIINGARTQSITKNYIFKPLKNITIPPFDISIDGNIVKTKAKTIKLLKVEKTISDLYKFDINVDKKDVFVGEEIQLDLNFRYKKDLDIVNLEFQKPDFENFWVKELNRKEPKQPNGEYAEQKLSYLLFPQKAGKLQIEPLKIGVVLRDNRYANSFFMTVATTTTPVYSNAIELDIKKLPNKLKLIGDFKISASIDKNIVEQGDAVSYKVHIEGRGNIDDIDEVKLNIANATIYDNPSKKEYNLNQNGYGGTYTKAFSIVATDNFTIPPIEINYFDKRTQKAKTIQTKEYKIQVNKTVQNSSQLEVLQDKPKETITEEKIVTKVITTSDNEKIIYFLFGFFIAILLVVLYNILKNKKVKKIDIPLIKSIKQSKTKSELLNIIIAYIAIDENLDKIIFEIENNNDTQKIKSFKKSLIEVIEELEKKDIRLDTKL